MSEHYFSEKPQSIRSPRTWNYQLRGKWYTFTSDIGVFSKREVDFGSRLLIESFVAPHVSGDLLDLGCGYGPIGIAFADEYKERTVVMVDINTRAIELAKGNAKDNKISNVHIHASDRFSSIQEQKFAAIITNPPIRAGKRTVHAMLVESHDFLIDNGELWIVIQKKQGAPSAKAKLQELFQWVDVVAKSKGYYVIRAIK